MDPILIGLIGLGILFLLFFLGMPISFAMAFVGCLGYSYLVSPSAGIKILVRDFFTQFNSYPLTVISTFVLMGNYAFAAGITNKLYQSSHKIFGSQKGGLAITTLFTSAGFAAICGSTAATVATVGKIAYPEMKSFKYNNLLSTGVIAASATLGILIPPSTIFIVYGIMTEQSIGKLFIAGIIPGLLLTFIFLLIIIALCAIKPELAPGGNPTPLKEKLKALFNIWEIILLFVITMGGLFIGWFTPTQAGSIGAIGALLIGLFTKKLTWNNFQNATIDGVRVACMILFLIAGATIFSHFLAITRLPFIMIDFIKSTSLSTTSILILIIIFYLVAGCFIDAMALIVLTIPIFYPLIKSLGVDPIWFGVIIVLVSQIGVISPPVGVNAYVMKGIAPEVPLSTIFSGSIIFSIGIIITTIIIIIFPSLATWLPRILKW